MKVLLLLIIIQCPIIINSLRWNYFHPLTVNTGVIIANRMTKLHCNYELGSKWPKNGENVRKITWSVINDNSDNITDSITEVPFLEFRADKGDYSVNDDDDTMIMIDKRSISEYGMTFKLSGDYEDNSLTLACLIELDDEVKQKRIMKFQVIKSFAMQIVTQRHKIYINQPFKVACVLQGAHFKAEMGTGACTPIVDFELTPITVDSA